MHSAPLEFIPLTYLCRKVADDAEFPFDGGAGAWASAPWTADFVDIEGDVRPKPRFRTRVKMLWNNSALWILADMEEPHVWGTLTEHDSVIFHNNNFEVFVDPNGDNHMYVELQLNALNTIWDLLLPKPYRDGGPPVDGFEIKGLETHVSVLGSLNDHSDVDRCWRTVIKMPWIGLHQVAGTPCPPRPGDQWKINFSRVEWHHEVVEGRYRRVPNTKEDNWVWSPIGAIDMHRPEKWGVVQFADELGQPALRPPDGEPERDRLMKVYWAQKEFLSKSGHYALRLEDLNLQTKGVGLFTTPSGFEAHLGEFRLDHTSRFWRVPRG